MKVTFKYGIKTYSGTMDDITFGSYRKGDLCIGREYVIPKLTENNTLMGAVMKNLASIYGSLSTGFKADLDTYATLNVVNTPRYKLVAGPYAIFVKLMYSFSKLGAGHIDLATVTYEDLETVGADISTIALAISNGYLANVANADTLINMM